MGPSDARARPIARGAVADGQGAASDDDGADSALSVGLDGQEDLLIGALERTPEGASKADDPHEYFCVVCSNGGSLVRGARSPERPLRERVFSPPRCSPSRRRCGGTPTQTRGFSSAWASSACLPRMRTGRAAVRAPKKGLQAAVSRGGNGRVPPCARGAGVCAVAGASARGRNRSGSALSGCAGERDPRVVCTSLEEALRRRRAGKGACGGSLLCEVATLTEYTSHALRPAAREPCRAPPLPRHYRTPESDSGAQQKDILQKCD